MSNSSRGGATLRQILTLVGALIGVCALGGALLAGMAMPIAATAGTSVNAVTSMFEQTPEDLGFVEPSAQSVILAADGTEIASFYAENRIVVASDAISKHMKDAVVSIEDRRFYQHNGIDVQGLAGALVNNVTGGSTAGGSTITQQYVKNALVEQGRVTGDDELVESATEKTIARKLNEARLAVAIEKKLSKDEILTAYINLAQFGPARYGAEAASQYFFSKSAKDLTVAEAALLAGITQSPARWNPVKHPEAATTRRNVVLGEMLRNNYISQQEYDEAVNTTVSSMLHITDTPNGCAAAGNAAYFCEYVVNDLLNDESWGKDRDDRVAQLYRGGLVIHTTLDLNKQNAAQAVLVNNVPSDDKSGIQMALSSVEPGTGHIVAMAQNTNFGSPSETDKTATKVNLNVSRKMGGGAGFQSGSTFKIFTLLEWIKNGRSPYEYVNSNDGTINRNQWNISCSPRSADKYTFHNLEGIGGGQMTVLESTKRSVNGSFVRMAQQFDLCNIANNAMSMGVERGDGNDWEYFPSMILGANTVTPLSMADAVATLAADGKHCKPMSFTKVENTSGESVVKRSESCDQAIDIEVARETTQVLQQVVARGSTGERAQIAGRQVAGKTGTSNLDQNAWFVGYTPQLASAIWQGHQSGSISMFDAVIKGRYYDQVYGGLFPAKSFSEYMAQALANEPVVPFAAPNKSVIRPPAAETRSADATEDSAQNQQEEAPAEEAPEDQAPAESGQ